MRHKLSDGITEDERASRVTQQRGGRGGSGQQEEWDAVGEEAARRETRLTPMHRLRQLEPSWLRSGQTTSSLLLSVMEKDEVREDRGGMTACLGGCRPHHAVVMMLANRGVD